MLTNQAEPITFLTENQQRRLAVQQSQTFYFKETAGFFVSLLPKFNPTSKASRYNTTARATSQAAIVARHKWTCDATGWVENAGVYSLCTQQIGGQWEM